MGNRYRSDSITVTTDVSIDLSDITEQVEFHDMLEAYGMSADDVLPTLDSDEIFEWVEKQDDLRGKLLAQVAQQPVEFTDHHTGLFTTASVNGETRAVLVLTDEGVKVSMSSTSGAVHFTASNSFAAQRMVRALVALESMESAS